MFRDKPRWLIHHARQTVWIASLLMAVLVSSHVAEANAQESKAQVLEQELTKESSIGSIRTDILNDLAEALLYANPVDALTYAREALNGSESLNYAKGRIAGHRNIGLAQLYLGQTEAAYFNLNRAMTLADDSIDSQLQAKALLALGMFYELSYNLERARGFFLQALEKASTRELWLVEAQAQTKIGDILTRMSLFSEAEGYYRSAMASYEKVEDSSLLANAMTGLGVSFYKQGQFDRAIETLNEAATRAFQNGLWSSYGKALVQLAHTYCDIGDYERAIDQYNYILGDEYASRFSVGFSQTYLGLGLTYQKTGDLEKAQQYLEEGLQQVESQNLAEEKSQLIQALINLYKSQKDYPKALEYAERLITVETGNLPEGAAHMVRAMEAEQVIRDYESRLEINQYEMNEQESNLLVLWLGISILVLVVVILLIFVYLRRKRLQILSQERDNILVKSEQRAQLLRIIGFDLRGPLKNILSSLARLSSHRDEVGADRQVVSSAQLASQSALLLSTNVYDLALMDEGEFEISHEAFVPAISLDEVLDLWRLWIEESGMSFRLSFAREFYNEVSAPLTQIEKILVNLINITLKSMDSGEIAVTGGMVEENGQTNLYLTVRDSGLRSSQFYDVNYQKVLNESHNKLSELGEAGLGLAVVKLIVKRIHADIGYEALADGSRQFWLSVPVEKIPERSY